MAEPTKTVPTSKPSVGSSARWPMLAVTTLLAAGVAFMFTPTQLRFFLTLESHRKSILAHPKTRDLLLNVAYFRDLDQQLPSDTKIFFSGVVGPNNRLFPYFFARTFLFPREMEISLDHQADYQLEGFRGVDCSSPEQLRTNGYDLMLKVDQDYHISALPLTEKGAFKQ